MHFFSTCSYARKILLFFCLENDFCTYLRQVISSGTYQDKNAIVQMDEIHVKSDITYKSGKIFGHYLSTKNLTRTVFAIMVSSLHKKWSCISRLIPFETITAEYLLPIFKSCILDIESCGLKVQIISTDNYHLTEQCRKIFGAFFRIKARKVSFVGRIFRISGVKRSFAVCTTVVQLGILQLNVNLFNYILQVDG